MGPIGEDLWKKNERKKMPKSNISGQKSVGCTGTGCAVGNLYRYRSKLYWYRLFQQPHFCLFCTVKSHIHTPIV